MSRAFVAVVAVAAVVLGLPVLAGGQPLGEADRGLPGDPWIQEYLRAEAEKIEASFAEDLVSLEAWEARRSRYREEYLEMLGLWPLPERTPLAATVTGSLSGEGFQVDLLHYQSVPGLYVTANLYRPAAPRGGERLPAVLYVCGHSHRGRDGNKTAYQSHGIWFARHGYICLVLDTLQLGEIAAIHHGTYREGRWWWHSRGYTPAGVECWNGIRGIDYLAGRPDVDAERIAVTGISGGGAATFWIAAADERVRAAAPVSGMADLLSYVPNRVINGHCDCMFLHNSYRWPWTRIASLIAPRPLLFVNSDQDGIFPMDANQRVIDRLERVYSLYGAGDRVDAVVSIGGHAYRQDIRQAVYRFVNLHLKGDAAVVEDSEIDLVEGPRDEPEHPLAPEKLRVFPTDADLPADQKNTTIDQLFVPRAIVSPPSENAFDEWKAGLWERLKRSSFGYFPDRVPAARPLSDRNPEDPQEAFLLETEPGIRVSLRLLRPAAEGSLANRIVLVVEGPDGLPEDAWERFRAMPEDAVFALTPRGVGPTRWTTKNPPNYVERAHALLGRTVDTGRVWDVAAVARYLADQRAAGDESPVAVAGTGAAAALAAYAALWAVEIEQVFLDRPPASHQEASAPSLLNVLRVCDLPTVYGSLAPRPLVIQSGARESEDQVAAIYRAAGAEEVLRISDATSAR